MLKLEEQRIFSTIGGDIHALNEENSHPPTCLIFFEVPKKSARISSSKNFLQFGSENVAKGCQILLYIYGLI